MVPGRLGWGIFAGVVDVELTDVVAAVTQLDDPVALRAPLPALSFSKLKSLLHGEVLLGSTGAWMMCLLAAGAGGLGALGAYCKLFHDRKRRDERGAGGHTAVYTVDCLKLDLLRVKLLCEITEDATIPLDRNRLLAATRREE